jgi:hypothetical protein
MGFLLGAFGERQKHAARHLLPGEVVPLEVAGEVLPLEVAGEVLPLEVAAEEGILLQFQVERAWEGVAVVPAVEDKIMCER